MHVAKIQEARVLDEHTMLVTFTDGKRKKYDVTPLLARSMFEPLKTPAFFKNLHVEQRGYAVVWNDEIDISEYELWKNGEDTH